MKQQLKIEGMHCTSCALNIDFDLEELPGVTKATTHYASSILEVDYDPKSVSQDQIIESIKKTGYAAAPVDKP